MGTVHTMSNQGSEHEEVEYWGETSTKTHPDTNSAGWTEEAAALEKPSKPRWSVDVWKKEEWEEVTLTMAANSMVRGVRWKGCMMTANWRKNWIMPITS